MDTNEIQGNYIPPIVEITSALEFTISKQNAKSFHNNMATRILNTGKGLFEYIETLKLFEKVLKVFTGDSSSKNPEEKEGDKELKKYLLDEIAKYGKSFTTPRGVKFELAETGTKYHYEKCQDPILIEMEQQLGDLQLKIEERKEFLKTVPTTGMVVTDKDSGETFEVYPPYKTSTSGFKVTLPK